MIVCAPFLQYVFPTLDEQLKFAMTLNENKQMSKEPVYIVYLVFRGYFRFFPSGESPDDEVMFETS